MVYFLMDKPKERTPFVGAIYEPDSPTSGNRKAEQAVVYLALTGDELCDSVFEKLVPRDFCYDDCRFVFAELVMMHTAKEPVKDKAAQLAWFRRPEVVQRMRKAKLDDWFDGEQPLAASAILELVIGSEWASVANLDWYILELRRWRVVRGLRMLCWDLSNMIENHEPLKVLAWLGEMLEHLKAVAEPLKRP